MQVDFDDSLLNSLGETPEEMLRVKLLLEEAMKRFEADLSVVHAQTGLTFDVSVAVGKEDEDGEGEAEQGNEEGP